MNAELNRSLLKWNMPLFWFTFLIPAAIIGLGINFIVNPVGASAGFGIPMTDPSAFPFMWIKGIRDIFAGVAVLVLLFRGDRRTIAIIYSISMFIAIGDGFVILRQLGFAPPIFIHWGTATYMAIIAILLHRGNKA
ncbi:hypothetical protein FHW67_003197 [Herbaspirillum sp. Sphag1AN]|uniref:DUF4267 domain-containing protein n=1 Tax=unclassified Herbaspirillum TaxID=2624150 RepID=UPI00161856AF|nr:MULTISPECIES: DUF4267 domain-containing protein [unclassified Herbaspirillum]MBB3213891.1 hypothetical protein [Herbaspirillum sp. Sphag1AN]MBB3247088.1 hypothetical protein [Herbaspirillum sp. Sphag64]